MTRPDEGGLRTLGFGTPKDGGQWGWWFCADCNKKTGRWDEEYLRWWRPLVEEVHLLGKPIRELLLCEFSDADPGAMVRCLWAWGFALDPTLLDRHPGVAVAVRDGTAVEPPADRRVLLALTPSLKFWYTHARDVLRVETSLQDDGWLQRESRLWAPGPEITKALPAVISAPPFVVVLADEDDDIDFPCFDPSSWLQERAGARRRTTFNLPMVQVVDEGLAHPVTHLDIRALPLLDQNRGAST